MSETLEAIAFLRRFNSEIFSRFPEATTAAEESTAWPMVSRPVEWGGLGFGYKWNMGWMHDTLDYIAKDPIYRSSHHNQLLFSLMYAFSENFVLPFSHDEVVYGKGSMIRKMPGDDWQRFANLRLLYGYMFGHPGKKLLFMGDEFGQWNEWNHDGSLDWHLIAGAPHKGLQRWVRDLNTFLRGEPALYEFDADPASFEWVDCNDMSRSVISFLRKGRNQRDTLLFVCNFTPATHRNYRLGAPEGGFWKERSEEGLAADSAVTFVESGESKMEENEDGTATAFGSRGAAASTEDASNTRRPIMVPSVFACKSHPVW